MARMRVALSILFSFGAAAALLASSEPARAQTNVTTYHNDLNRTGWNQGETQLSASAVGGGTFNLQQSVQLDEQVDAQPLFVENQTIPGVGARNVIYVVTENNTVYGIDAANGSILVARTLGVPVPESTLPGACPNNSGVVGIGSTPVISTARNTIWVIAYTYESNQPIYRLHALDLGTLADKTAPVLVTASGTLADGSTYVFNPSASRQRAALTYANGAIYAAFASFCDLHANLSRGWLLGWNASTLAPFPANELTNTSVGAPSNFYLTSIWMSGYGLSTLGQGDALLFITGNADPSGTTYNSQTNLAESVVKISPDLTKVEGFFTPSNESQLDNGDLDFGSGGVMVLPTQSGSIPNLAVAAGKDGRMFLLNRNNLGGFTEAGRNMVLGTYPIGGCWCGPSYFVGSDGVGRIVSSGANAAIVWRFNNTHRIPTLTKESQTPMLQNGQRGQTDGFFTSISSNGTQAGSAVIWAVSRPITANPADVMLYAFNAADGTQLFSGVAGTWPNTDGNANIVPTVAAGRAYVASYKELTIFGLGAPATAARLDQLAAIRTAARVASNTAFPLAAGQHEIYGIVTSRDLPAFTARKRDGTPVTVDMQAALAASNAAMPTVGQGVLVRGRYGANGVLVADTVIHAKSQPALWPDDR